MSDATDLAMSEVLVGLGFKVDGSVMSDDFPGLTCDFGNFKLSASHALSPKSFRNVVLFTGVLRTDRSIAEVHFEMLQRIASRELCAAWIAWHLDQAADGEFTPIQHADWIEEGRQHFDQLPWDHA